MKTTSSSLNTLKQQMLAMNNKEQPPEVFYEKAVLKTFSILTGKYKCSSLFLIKLWPFRSVVATSCGPDCGHWKSKYPSPRLHQTSFTSK